ncbi:MAG: AsmA family protein [Bdellovibrionia bacterium]
MRKAARRTGLLIGIVVGLFVLALICISLFFDANPYKSKIRAAVAQSTAMDLQIRGDIRFKLFPSARIVLHDVHLKNRGTELLAAQTIEATPKLFSSLIHQEIRIGKIALNQPTVHLEKTANGKMNYEPASPSKGKAGKKADESTPAGEIQSIQIDNGELNYVDRSTQKRIQARGVNTHLSGVDWSDQNIIQSLSLNGSIEARSIQVGDVQATDLRTKIHADHGILRLDSTHAKVFSGTIQGTAQGDFQSKTPKWTLDQKMSQVEIKQIAQSLKDKISGLIDGSIKLNAVGSESQSIMRSLNGIVSIQSQNFKLNAPKLTNLASILSSMPGANSGFSGLGLSEIQKLVMDWSIKNGIAQAKDVALSTPKSTVAARGSIDLRDRKFQNFFVATVDEKGCSKRQMEIAGPLDSPHPSSHSVGKELAGILGGILPSSGCDHFYSGSLARPG